MKKLVFLLCLSALSLPLYLCMSRVVPFKGLCITHSLRLQGPHMYPLRRGVVGGTCPSDCKSHLQRLQCCCRDCSYSIAALGLLSGQSLSLVHICGQLSFCFQRRATPLTSKHLLLLLLTVPHLLP